MELSKGFKQTEAGIIPEDWSSLTLGPHVQIKSGESPSLFSFGGDGVPYFKVEQLNNDNKYLQTTSYFINGNRTVPRGSLIFPKRGASILLNKIRILKKDSFMDTNLMAVTPDSSLYNEFLYYLLTHIQLWKIADTTSIPQINNKHIIPLVIPVPKTRQEQEAIANALSDADAYIESLEKLIDKKRLIKKGVMQELLTGKRRLGGLKDKWKQETIGSICLSIQGGGTPSRSNSLYWDGGIPWMTVKDFAAFDPLTTIEYISKEGMKNSATKLIPAGTLIVATRMAVGKTAIYDVDVCINQDLKALAFRPDISTMYAHYWFQYQQGMISSLGSGSTVMGLNADELRKLEIEVPCFEEQNAISEVLKDIDLDIFRQENELQKVHLLRQGMMQELLTGRIRLV